MMKNIFRIVTLLIASVMLIPSCSKDINPFNGTDAHIVSFSLTVDGVKYPATIVGEQITVSIPTSVDLKKATVEYVLCENATIQPDPATINNWNEEHLFRVQARNSNYTSYRYIINHTNVINGEDILLTTQTDVNAFAKQHINSISGNLVIGSPNIAADPIIDLSGLYDLKEVKYNLVINNSFAGTSLHGLDNLEHAGGIYIGTENVRAVPQHRMNVELPALKQSLNVIINSDSVEVVSFAKLQSAGNIYINSINTNKIELPVLQECTGNIAIKGQNGGGNEKSSNLVLSSLQLPSLKSVMGSLLIENFWNFSSLTLPMLENVGNELNLKYIRTAKSISLPVLKSTGGAFNIQANDGMTRLSAPKLETASSVNIASVNSYSINLKNIDMSSFKSVDGDFTVQYFGSTQLSFPALKSIGNKLNLANMQFVETINIPQLTSCEELTLQANPMLEKFDVSKVENLKTLTLNGCLYLVEFKSPETISGNVTLSGANKVNDNAPFVGLKTIGGKLTVSSYTTNKALVISGIESIGSYTQSSGNVMTSLSLPDLTVIGDLTLSNMKLVKSISAPKLTTTGNLNIKGLLALTTIDFSNLTTINGTLTFYGGSYASQASQSQTTNLNGFSSVSSVTKVDIRFAGKLADFSGLKNLIPNLASTAWTVQGCSYNPTYQNMVDAKYTNE